MHPHVMVPPAHVSPHDGIELLLVGIGVGAGVGDGVGPGVAPLGNGVGVGVGVAIGTVQEFPDVVVVNVSALSIVPCEILTPA